MLACSDPPPSPRTGSGPASSPPVLRLSCRAQGSGSLFIPPGKVSRLMPRFSSPEVPCGSFLRLLLIPSLGRRLLYTPEHTKHGRRRGASVPTPRFPSLSRFWVSLHSLTSLLAAGPAVPLPTVGHGGPPSLFPSAGLLSSASDFLLVQTVPSLFP